MTPKGKEFIYVGYYIDIDGNYILKIGTTNSLERRQSEHTRNYRKASKYRLAADDQFRYVWWHPLSKYNTLRFEDINRELWQVQGVGEYIRNDRFKCPVKPEKVFVKIRKKWEIAL